MPPNRDVTYKTARFRDVAPIWPDDSTWPNPYAGSTREQREAALPNGLRLIAELTSLAGVVAGARPGSGGIVSVEATEEAERRGLVLVLPASIEVTVVGDTGFEPVTSRM